MEDLGEGGVSEVELVPCIIAYPLIISLLILLLVLLACLLFVGRAGILIFLARLLHVFLVAA